MRMRLWKHLELQIWIVINASGKAVTVAIAQEEAILQTLAPL